MLPAYPNFIGSSYPHVGPWGYDQNVPVLWYGPDHIRAAGKVSRPVTLADIAPTEARLLGFPFSAPDGRPMREALLPAATTEPKLVVTLVWDAGGRDVLAAWPKRWPYLRSLIQHGTWYEHATVGSSPSSTAQDHVNIGTGAFPRTSGIIAHHLRIGDQIVGPFDNGPDLLVRPTLADLYGRAMDGRAKIGEVATVNIHLGMIGHGSMWGGGDKGYLILREQAGASTQGAESSNWNLPAADKPFFRFPSWVGSLPPLSHDFPTADASDGTVDGTWRGMDIAAQKGGFDTPARIPNETRVIENLITREGFGADATPDLLMINYKLIDEVGHIWNMNSLEMHDALKVQDEYLGVLIRFLNRQVGKGQWAMVVTADHGAVPDPAITGAVQLSQGKIQNAIDGGFDTDGDSTPLVEAVYQTGIFLNPDELARNAVSIADIAAFVMTLTNQQVAAADVTVPTSKANQPAFQAAYPSDVMHSLSCLPEARTG